MEKVESLKTEKWLNEQLSRDYSSLSGQIKIDNNIIEIGTPIFAENGGSDLIFPNSLTEMFPEEIKTFFGESFRIKLPHLPFCFNRG